MTEENYYGILEGPINYHEERLSDWESSRRLFMGFTIGSVALFAIDLPIFMIAPNRFDSVILPVAALLSLIGGGSWALSVDLVHTHQEEIDRLTGNGLNK